MFVVSAPFFDKFLFSLVFENFELLAVRLILLLEFLILSLDFLFDTVYLVELQTELFNAGFQFLIMSADFIQFGFQNQSFPSGLIQFVLELLYRCIQLRDFFLFGLNDRLGS